MSRKVQNSYVKKLMEMAMELQHFHSVFLEDIMNQLNDPIKQKKFDFLSLPDGASHELKLQKAYVLAKETLM